MCACLVDKDVKGEALRDSHVFQPCVEWLAWVYATQLCGRARFRAVMLQVADQPIPSVLSFLIPINTAIFGKHQLELVVQSTPLIKSLNKVRLACFIVEQQQGPFDCRGLVGLHCNKFRLRKSSLEVHRHIEQHRAQGGTSLGQNGPNGRCGSLELLGLGSFNLSSEFVLLLFFLELFFVFRQHLLQLRIVCFELQSTFAEL
mmetsp:Transcript_107/g.241  ORF Transcript_107/g.241 Transcript_107/m.241 type:complete len:202 (+) Transcript_107:228-833(+)